MFDFGNANEGQRQAISAVNGPVLITAGPGTGKTYTLVQRAIYLIEECRICPENLFIATFTEKAAKELITRITNELANRNITVNVNEMYIGTFHSLSVKHPRVRALADFLEKNHINVYSPRSDMFFQRYEIQLAVGCLMLMFPRYVQGLENGALGKHKNKNGTKKWRKR